MHKHFPFSMARLILCAAILQPALQTAAAGEDDCANIKTPHVLVRLEQHDLLLCADGRQQGAKLSVRIGRGGVGKTKEGDKKTPVGEYPLGQTRRSDRYGWFIPIGYPTEMQKAQGYTGSAVGIHGPDRRVRWLGRMVNWFDTTSGCVGLVSDEDVERVGQWAGRVGARTVLLEVR